MLNVFGKEEDWLLVQSQKEGGKIGYVPGNYVEEVGSLTQLEVAYAHYALLGQRGSRLFGRDFSAGYGSLQNRYPRLGVFREPFESIFPLTTGRIAF